MADVRTQALGYLRSGSVTIGAARRPKTSDRPDFVSARVAGHRSPFYQVHLIDERWFCSCRGQWDDGMPCAHLAAVQLVTGHPSAADKAPSDADPDRNPVE